jgi:hypothetical protein
MQALRGRRDITPTTLTLEGVSDQRHSPAALYPKERTPATHWIGAWGRASQLAWTQRLQEKSFAYAGDRTPVVQTLVRHYTDWAPPAPFPNHHSFKYCSRSLLFNFGNRKRIGIFNTGMVRWSLVHELTARRCRARHSSKSHTCLQQRTSMRWRTGRQLAAADI